MRHTFATKSDFARTKETLGMPFIVRKWASEEAEEKMIASFDAFIKSLEELNAKLTEMNRDSKKTLTIMQGLFGEAEEAQREYSEDYPIGGMIEPYDIDRDNNLV